MISPLIESEENFPIQKYPKMVNTFLIHPNFTWNAKALDARRVFKQVVEAMQLINAITGEGKRGWTNHPAARSWVNNVDSLKLYYNAVLAECLERGINTTLKPYKGVDPAAEPPYWLDCPAVHWSHMAQLRQKEGDYYSHANLKDKVPAELLAYFDSMPEEYTKWGYVWPYKHTREELLTLPVAQLAEPYQERIRCSHAGCRNKASFGEHCGNHRDKSIVIGPCQGHYKNGNPCRNKAKYGSSFCGSHGGVTLMASTPASIPRPANSCQATCKTGLPCRNRAKVPSTLCGVHTPK